ncbi:P-loop NTPase fold protein [Vibrio jasicida]|uniref:P-loop NTPase fold protein n=1 Tax=Vibrio jasicida TaxID=766224 RepID=UPI0005F06933|nr:P-loop NTPase fold protein [Vibrio jasicida]
MSQSQQIIELLQDKSFPQVLLIDGAWGSGKTHFIRQNLISKLEGHFEHKVFFFSLYGISSIDDFRDKVISLQMNGSENSSEFAGFVNKIIDGAANNLGEKGVGAILGGAAGAYKYSLYNALDNCILILDDLERVSDDNSIKNILGECLNMAESKNIKIIVVANEEKLTCKNDIEKVFADKYKFGFAHEQVVDFLRFEYPDLEESVFNEIQLNITSLDSKNIRVLKRAISKFSRLKSEIEVIENVIHDQAFSKLVSDVIRICYAKYECGYSKDKIIDAIETRVIRAMDKNDDTEGADKDYQKLDSIFNDSFYGTSPKLIDYCCDGIYGFNDLKVDLNLPIQASLIDSMRSLWRQNQLSESEFEEGVILLEGFIKEAVDVDIYDWFSACDVYCHLIDSKAIEQKNLSISHILSLCNEADVSRFKLPEVMDRFGSEFGRDFYSLDIKERYTSKKSQLIDLAKNHKNVDFTNKFVVSWASVNDEVYKNLMHTPIYQNLNVTDVERALLNWTNEELFQFVRLNNHRYQFSNIYDFFEAEIPALKSIVSMLPELSAKIGFGLKVASINELHKCFSEAVSRMEKHLKKIDTTETAS